MLVVVWLKSAFVYKYAEKLNKCRFRLWNKHFQWFKIAVNNVKKYATNFLIKSLNVNLNQINFCQGSKNSNFTF